jgi:hypothetical protein
MRLVHQLQRSAQALIQAGFYTTKTLSDIAASRDALDSQA